ncbi:hypothetical protein [Actinocorallia populi]|uniref:hypothetical protein n=1 Tax=Actinocorallia populi TaxID=2079200 RepID=UPI000D08BD66|nr:hypothetical protein [Actinocorallia populi]
MTLGGSLKGADGDPLPGQVLKVDLVEDDGAVRFGTTAKTDAQGGCLVTEADRFGGHLTARVTWSGDGSRLVARKEIEVGFLHLRMGYNAVGNVGVAFESFLEQGPDVHGFVVQRSFDGSALEERPAGHRQVHHQGRCWAGAFGPARREARGAGRPRPEEDALARLHPLSRPPPRPLRRLLNIKAPTPFA